MLYPHLKVLTILNHKGGCGKTTLAKLLAEFAALFLKVRILVIDLDPQANLSTRFVEMVAQKSELSGYEFQELKTPPVHPNFDPNDTDWQTFKIPPPGYWSTAELFRYGYVDPYPSQFEGLEVIPGHTTGLTDLMLEVGKASIEKEFINILMILLSDNFYQEQYDLVIIDTPPQVSPITISAVHCATHLVVPTQLAEDSMEGFGAAIQLWQAENMKKRDPDTELKLVGILPTFAEHKKYAEQRKYYEDLVNSRTLSKYLLKNYMSRMATYSKTSTSFANPDSLFQCSAKLAARKEAEGFCSEILGNVFNRTIQLPSEQESLEGVA